VYTTFLLFITVAVAAFICDIGIFFSYHDQFFYFVLYLYIFELLRAQHLRRLFFLAALISLESFMFYSTLWAPLITLIPLTIAEIKLRHNFYQSGGYALGVATLVLGSQILIIEPFFMGVPPSLTYTFLKVCANIGIIGILSLKQYYQDKRDNRGAQF
jgi:hypothetical protein